ncbi:MAG: hypothetical protein ENTB_04228 [Enterocloster aldenensis]
MSKYLSRNDLERIADTVVNKYYGMFPQEGVLPTPVEPEKLAKMIFGLEVSYLPLSVDGSVLGLSCFQEIEIQLCGEDGVMYKACFTGRDIVIDDSLLQEPQKGRRNFTTAHEIAHHALVRLYPTEYRSLLNRRTHILYRHRSRVRDWEEWQADTMAAAILMPTAVLCQCMAVFGLGERLDMLSSVCRPREYERFCDVASYMGVSKKALAIRMRRLGLLGEDYLENPYAPLDVWRDENECEC